MSELFIKRSLVSSGGSTSGTNLSLVVSMSGAATSATSLIEANKVYLVEIYFTYSWGGTQTVRNTYILNTTEGMSKSGYVWDFYGSSYLYFNFTNNTNGSITVATSGCASQFTKVYEIVGLVEVV